MRDQDAGSIAGILLLKFVLGLLVVLVMSGLAGVLLKRLF